MYGEEKLTGEKEETQRKLAQKGSDLAIRK